MLHRDFLGPDSDADSDHHASDSLLLSSPQHSTAEADTFFFPPSPKYQLIDIEMKSVPTIADAEETSITDQILLPVLEQKIFETTAFLHPSTILKLLLVARRVHFWIEPMLYNTVEIVGLQDKRGSGAVVLRAIDTKPAGFFHKAVRNLFLFPVNWSFFCDRPKDPWSDEELARVLRACSGVVNLVLFADSSPVTLPMLAEMRPLRITLIAGTTLDLTHPVFNNVRRLNLIDVSPEDYSIFENEQHLRNLTRLSDLTHIAFPSRIASRILNTILSGCLNLQTVLLLGEGFTREAAELHDQRLVVDENHQDFFEGGKDIWARVDEFMARRQRGEIPDSCFHLLTAPEL